MSNKISTKSVTNISSSKDKPGIPLVIPGEVLDKSMVDWLLAQSHLFPDQFKAEVRIVK